MESYENNVRKYRSTAEDLENDLKNISLLRLIVFLSSAAIIVFLANERALGLLLIVAPLCAVGFGALVKRYNELDSKKRHITFLKEINERELLRLANQLTEFPTGQRYVQPDHPYVSDLDVFGQHSLFQLINRTTTESGEQTLAGWMNAPAEEEEIKRRQEAIRELSSRLEWRQAFQAAGMQSRHAVNAYARLVAWAQKPLRLLTHRWKYLTVVIPLSIVSTWTLIYFVQQVLVLGQPGGVVPLLLSCLVNSLVLKRVRPVAEEITENLQENIGVLGGYHDLIAKVESEAFTSAMMQDRRSALTLEGYSAAAEIIKLKKTFEFFQLRGRKGEMNHFFYAVLNVLWFLDVYLSLLTEKWKARNGTHLGPWSSAVSDVEALASLAGFHFSNPSFTFPKITDHPYTLRFEKMGHPLIRQEKRVCNDFSLRGRGEIAMITGSNMAGKSTFLRSVGVNIVLGLMGAPCCAVSAEMSIIKVFSSMRTQDNLEEGVSSFYAELKRIEQLLKLIESGQPIFFLLDEMFKGTNSKDRHKGGFSLIKQLKELNAFGLISTHDLDLADLAGRDALIVNYSFNSGIADGGMIFNYQLMAGLCTDFNASELMRRSGIKVLASVEGK